MGGLAIIAGRGDLPAILAEACRAQAAAYLVARFDTGGSDWTFDHPGIDAKVTQFGALFNGLRTRGISQVVFAGSVTRPELNPADFDKKTLEIAPRLLASLGQGDDATLREIAAIFEDEGFEIVAAHTVLPTLVPPAGALGAHDPSPLDLADMKRAAQIVESLGIADVGQGAVVAQGICLGLESIQGTDQMLDFVARTAKPFRRDPGGAKGVLWKAAKPRQDLRMDMPTIGPETIVRAAAAGLAGVAYRAGEVMMLNRDETIKAADTSGLFIFGQA